MIIDIIIYFCLILFFVTNYKKKEKFTNNYLIKTIYINLEKDKVRNKKMIKLLDENNINYKRQNAVWGKNINLDDLNKKIIDNKGLEDIKNKKYKYGLSLTMGAIGCALSHYNIFYNIVEKKNNDKDIYLILEDDIKFEKNLIYNINQLLKDAPLNWDIIYIGYGPLLDNYKNKKIKDNWYKTNRVHGTFGYLLNKKGARKILDLFPIKYQIDTELYLASKNNKINSYIYKPQLIFHYNYSESNIQVNPKTLKDDNI
tara:strand:+ start:515 stop:1285 length:771 start_codon:yes stop_codon:yes gene_type:complete